MSFEEFDKLLANMTEAEIDALNANFQKCDVKNPRDDSDYHVDKPSSGPLDRSALIKFLKEKAQNEEDWKERVPYKKKSLGKFFQKPMVEKPLTEVEDFGFETELDADFSQLLENATDQELVDMAAMLGFAGLVNQEQFEASWSEKNGNVVGTFNDVTKATRPKSPKVEQVTYNEVDVDALLNEVAAGGGGDKVDLTNTRSGVTEDQLIRLFESLSEGSNAQVRELRLAHIGMSNKPGLACARMLSNNTTIETVNLESNLLSAETVLELVRAVCHPGSAVTRLQLANQSHGSLGVRIEGLLADAVQNAQGSRLHHLGLSLACTDSRQRVNRRLQANVDQARRQRKQQRT